jgi:hypothetical protein
LEEVVNRTGLEEGLSVKGTDATLSLTINNSLDVEADAVDDAGGAVAKDRKQHTSTAAWAGRPSEKPLVAGPGEASILAMVGMEEVKKSMTMHE